MIVNGRLVSCLQYRVFDAKVARYR